MTEEQYAFEMGCDAANFGEMRCANPHEEGSNKFISWNDGWITATEANQYRIHP